eukprot:GHVS01080013.1.p1 GENE.GHVS01080013.1~~GHVS01080013.1.p1  ORF type:complete len:1091 (-),score=213.21 GHVS01080013.1:45-3317(-)
MSDFSEFFSPMLEADKVPSSLGSSRANKHSVKSKNHQSGVPTTGPATKKPSHPKPLSPSITSPPPTVEPSTLETSAPVVPHSSSSSSPSSSSSSYSTSSSSSSSSATPAKEYKFRLDPFQQEAISYLEQEQSVLVSAHTSAGKTAVAEYAIAMGLRAKQRVIYTAPIKALSNQKYRDLSEEFKDVGLITGDVVVNAGASVIVMTTEILRGMLYRGAALIREMKWVIFDEIHYMRDRDRGVVWEETIILLPDTVRLVFLSATIPNAKDFAEWVSSVKHQPCNVVYTEYRPTPLQHFIFATGGDGVHLVMDEKKNFREENFHKAIASMNESVDMATNQISAGKNKMKEKATKFKEEIEKIVLMCSERQYTPVIVFAFSKQDCERNALAMKKVDLTSELEKQLVEEIFSNAIATLSDEDRQLPQLTSLLPLLRRGIGIHHSGLLPVVKEVIEILFQESLVRVLFSTETFSMGVNMPAKTVVFSKLSKWDGEDRRLINSGEYIQMAGRAGRRGLDYRGLVILMLDQNIEPEQARSILCGEALRLDSQFYLGYNMLLNLLRMEGADPEYMIQRSFRQFQNNKQRDRLLDARDKLQMEVDAFGRLNAFRPTESEVQSAVRAYGYTRLPGGGRSTKKRKQSGSRSVTMQCEGAEEEDAGNLDGQAVARIARDALRDLDDGTFVPEELVPEYYALKKDVTTIKDDIREMVMSQPFLAHYWKKGRVVYLRDRRTNLNWGWAVSVGNIRAQTSTKKSDPTGAPEVKYVADFLVRCEPSSITRVSGRVVRATPLTAGHEQERLKRDPVFWDEDDLEEKDSALEVMCFSTDCVYKLSSAVLRITQDYKQADARKEMWCAFKLTAEHFKKQGATCASPFPLINPMESMKTESPKLDDLNGQLEQKEEQLNNSVVHRHPLLPFYYEKWGEKMEMEKKLSSMRVDVEASSHLIMKEELRKRHRILRQLDYVDASGVVTLKGRIACEISAGDELIAAELLFQNVFDELEPEYVVAILMCLVFDEKNSEASPKDPKLVAGYEKIMEIAKKEAEVSIECGLDVQMDEFLKKFRPEMCEIVLGWCQGKSFCEVMEGTNIYEGSVIRCMR